MKLNEDGIMDQMHLKVSGMKCSSCEVIIERKLKEIPGVKAVKVNRAREEAVVKCDCEIDLGILQNAVQKEGYTLTRNSDLNHHNRISCCHLNLSCSCGRITFGYIC